MVNKQDAGKEQMRLLPWSGLKIVTRVLEFGARKYSEFGWRKQKNAQTRYLDAAFRHMAAHAEGELIDNESGLPHLAHAASCLLFILDLRSKVKETRSMSISREHLVHLTGEEIRAIFEDHRQTDLDATAVI